MPHAGRRIAAVVPTIVVMLLGLAGGADAHDKLLFSTPPADGTTEAAPSEVRLTFNGGIQSAASRVIVTDASGSVRSQGAPRVEQGTLVQPVGGPGTAGRWRLAYRVVSSDGHPITGTVAFDVVTVPTATSPATRAPGDPPPSVLVVPRPDTPPTVAAPPRDAGAAEGNPRAIGDDSLAGDRSGSRSGSLGVLMLGAGLALAVVAVAAWAARTSRDRT